MNFAEQCNLFVTDATPRQRGLAWWDTLQRDLGGFSPALVRNLTLDDAWPYSDCCRGGLRAFCNALVGVDDGTPPIDAASQVIEKTGVLVACGPLAPLAGQSLSKAIPTVEALRYLTPKGQLLPARVGTEPALSSVEDWAHAAARRPTEYLDQHAMVRGPLPVAFWFVSSDLVCQGDAMSASEASRRLGLPSSAKSYLVAVTPPLSDDDHEPHVPTCWDAFTHKYWQPPPSELFGRTRATDDEVGRGDGVREVVTVPWEVRQIAEWRLLE